MRAPLFLLFVAVYVRADHHDNRHSKLPYIADAVGNTLPPPSNVPATVGSPINLLSPDRYEFYTFDDSGELVKRLMTLEEIQAIVAAGEESEGLVTFANDNKPTIAFNFSQPPYNKVHSVVENVQNVLKAQMEAQKNRIETRPTLDTPDVSDTWSLILPSIFGNTGVDIAPEKISETFSTPNTDTLETDDISELDIENEIPFSKEGINKMSSSQAPEEDKTTPVTIAINSQSNFATTSSTKLMPASTSGTTSTSATASKPTSTSTSITMFLVTSSAAPFIDVVSTPIPTLSSEVPSTIITTTKIKTTPILTTVTTVKPKESSTVQTTTNKPRITSTTVKPIIQNSSTTITPSLTTKAVTPNFASTTVSIPNMSTSDTKLELRETTKTESLNITKKTNYTDAELTTNFPHVVANKDIVYEKISTFKPISTFSYVVERTTKKPVEEQNNTTIFSNNIITLTTPLQKSSSPSTLIFEDESSPVTDKESTISSDILSTTQFVQENKRNITTLSNASTLNPSSTVPTVTEKLHFFDALSDDKTDNDSEINDEAKDTEPLPPLFDVAQSISQIASDLGNYQPVPTITSMLNTTRFSDIGLESKENFELEIPTDFKNDENDYVKISTLNPLTQSEYLSTRESESKNGNKSNIETTKKIDSTSAKPVIDKTLTESMDDLLSQVVNQATHEMVDSNKISNNKNKVILDNQISQQNKIKNSTKNSLSTEIAQENVKQISVQPVKANNNNFTQHTSNEKTKNKLIASQLKPNATETSSKRDTNNKTNNQNLYSINKNKLGVKQETMSNKTKTKINNASSSKLENSITSEKLHKETSTATANPYKNITLFDTTYENKKYDMANVSNKSDIMIESVKPEKEKVNSSSDAIKKTNFTDFLPKVEEFKKKIQKVNIDDKELANERNTSWKLISTVSPPNGNGVSNKSKYDNHNTSDNDNRDIVLEFTNENQGLEVTTKDLGEDMLQFTELCNELAFRYWNAIGENLDKRRSFVLSPYSVTSMLAMMFMGARGATSGEMNEILKLDDMVTFNPHFTLKNISDSIEISPEAGVAVSAFVRELYSDRNKGKVLTFYKERAQQFYNGHVEEVNFDIISDIIRRRTNLLVKRYTWGRITEYMKANTITMQPPLASFSANIFQTDCTGTSVDGRDGEMYFVVSPNVRQRRLVPVPAVVYKKDFLAGYDPVLDATAAALGNTNSIVSTLFLMPGQQGNVVHAEDLEDLEKRLFNTNPTSPTWNRILRTLLPRMGLELQIPRFSHKSVFNISSTLRKMGLKDIFDAGHADLGGLNGPSKDLYLSDMIQTSSFVTCGEGVIGEQHHIEEYPENVDVTRRRRTSRWTDWDEPRDYQRAFHDPHDVGDAMHLPLHLRPRQARLPARDAQSARLKFDRPFLYFVRHNLSGMILYFGRYNPRLLP